MIVTHLSNHTPGVICTVHYISHLRVKHHEFVYPSARMKSHADLKYHHSPCCLHFSRAWLPVYDYLPALGNASVGVAQRSST